MRLDGGHKKPSKQKKVSEGENVQEIWVGLEPSLKLQAVSSDFLSSYTRHSSLPVVAFKQAIKLC